MSNIPNDLKYSKEHEWVKDLGNGEVLIGITDYAQDSLGDIVYIDLPDVGTQIETGETFSTIESVKAVSDIYAPLNGEIVETNSVVSDEPALLNKDPYVEGWLFKVKSDISEAEGLLDAEAYSDFLETL